MIFAAYETTVAKNTLPFFMHLVTKKVNDDLIVLQCLDTKMKERNSLSKSGATSTILISFILTVFSFLYDL